MKLLIDTDVFCKLGLANLLEDAAEQFDAKISECGRLPALKYMLYRSKLTRTFGEANCASLIPLADRMPPIQVASTEWLDPLIDKRDIDPGEAQLFAVAAQTGLLLMTGDKRALRSLKEISVLVKPLAKRIVVFEGILIKLCHCLGVTVVSDRVARIHNYDKVVGICFSSSNSNPLEALRSYFQSCCDEVSPIKLWTNGILEAL
jgi:hypothetical protein